MALELTNGLTNSLKVLGILKKDKTLAGISIYVGTFTNCREQGLTFIADNKKGRPFTWCVYEHRNSDEIIINGKPGFITLAGELPYKGDKTQYLASFKFGAYRNAANTLSAFIREYVKS